MLFCTSHRFKVGTDFCDELWNAFTDREQLAHLYFLPSTFADEDFF